MGIENEVFYNLCQNYRHAKDNSDVCNHYYSLIKYIDESLRQQLALKELENKTLRGALTMMAEDGWLSCGVEGLDEVQQKVYDIYIQPPVTTEHLQAWLKEQIGEPIAVTKDNGLILKYGFDDLPVNTNLHAVKE